MKKIFLYGFTIAVVVVIALLNVAMIENDRIIDLSLSNVEASAESEWNDWNDWFTQGATKDEREWMRPCPITESSSGQGGASHGNTSVSGGGSHSQTNPSNRQEITCPYGSSNCSAIGC